MERMKSVIMVGLLLGVIVLSMGTNATANNITKLDPKVEKDLNGVAWRPQGDYAVIVGDSKIVKYDGNFTNISNPSYVCYDIDWKPDGTYALIVCTGGNILKYTHATNQTSSITSPTNNNLRGVSWQPNGNYAIMVGDSGTIVRCTGTCASPTVVLIPGSLSEAQTKHFIAVDHKIGTTGPASDWAVIVSMTLWNKVLEYDEFFGSPSMAYINLLDDYFLLDISFNHSTISSKALITGIRSVAAGSNSVVLQYDYNSGLIYELSTFPQRMNSASWKQNDTYAYIVGNSGVVDTYWNGIFTIIATGTSQNLLGVDGRPINTGHSIIVGASGTFLIDDNPPSKSTPVSPANGEWITQKTPQLSWSAFSDPDVNEGQWRYRVQVSAVANFANTVYDSSWVYSSLTNHVPIVNLPEGALFWRVNVSDQWGLTSGWSASQSFNVDTISPDLTITAPVQDEIFNTTEVNVAGTASDLGSLLALVEISKDNATWSNAQGLAIWSGTLDLDEGQNTIYVKATDVAGNVANATVNVSVDTIFPQLSISSPSDGAIFNYSDITISGTASDVGLGLSAVEVSLDGSIWDDATGAETWEMDVILTEGDNDILVKATDLANNSVIETIGIVLDTGTPSLVISYPSDDEMINVSQIEVRGEASDTGTGPNMVQVSLDKDTWSSATGTSTWTADMSLIEGENTIYARAFDNASNWIGTEITVTVDTISPTLTIDHPPDESLTNDPNVQVSGTATDGGTGIKTVEISLNGRSWSEVTGDPWSKDLVLDEGKNIIHVRAFDMANNVVSEMIEVTVSLDIISPQIEIVSPTDGAKLATTDVVVRGTAIPGDADLVNIEVSTDQTTWVDATGTNTWEVEITLEDGQNTIYARVWDLNDFVAFDEIAVTVDVSKPVNTPPRITSTPLGEVEEGQVFNYEIIAEDDDPGDVLTYRLEVGPEGMVLDPTTNRLLWTTDHDDIGQHGVLVIVSDGKESATQYFTLVVKELSGPQSPTVTISDPLNGTTLKGKAKITGTAVKAKTSISVVEVKVDDGAWVKLQGTDSWEYTLDTTKLSNGEHTIRARALEDGVHSEEVSIVIKVNNKEDEADNLLGMFLPILILVVILLVIVGIVLMRRSTGKDKDVKKGREDSEEE